MSFGSADIGVSINPDLDVLAMLAEQLGQALEQRVAFYSNRRAIRRKMHDLIQKDFAADDSYLFLVWAAVALGIAIDGFGLARTEVVDVDYPIFVIIRLSAAVVVLESVLILELGWALVRGVEYPIFVVVRLCAAVVVLKTVAVFRSLRTLVARVGNTVLVVV
jgi:hypothetical protein